MPPQHAFFFVLFLCGVGNLNSAKGELSHHVVRCKVRHPRGSYDSVPSAVSGSGHTRKTNQLIRRSRPCARMSAPKAILSRLQVTHHATCPTPHGASHLVQAMSTWSVKVRRVPFGNVGIRGSVVIRLHSCIT